MLIWILDNEWNDYDIEFRMLREVFPEVNIVVSKNNFIQKAREIGESVDGIICQVDIPIHYEFLELVPNCRGISVYGSGYENIDLMECKKRNIIVTNVRNYCNDDIADYTMAAIYYAYKQIVQYADNIKNSISESRWGAEAITELPKRISNQVLFIIGLGNIGKAIAKKAGLLGLKILAYDEFLSYDQIKATGVIPTTWEEGFRSADYVSINLLGIEENRYKINIKEFNMMKKSAFIINTSRGFILNEVDLLYAVKNRIIGGAILDVLENEPPDINNPILSQKNILVTPHISYASRESLTELRALATQNIIDIIMNKDLISRVI